MDETNWSDSAGPTKLLCLLHVVNVWGHIQYGGPSVNVQFWCFSAWMYAFTLFYFLFSKPPHVKLFIAALYKYSVLFTFQPAPHFLPLLDRLWRRETEHTRGGWYEIKVVDILHKHTHSCDNECTHKKLNDILNTSHYELYVFNSGCSRNQVKSSTSINTKGGIVVQRVNAVCVCIFQRQARKSNSIRVYHITQISHLSKHKHTHTLQQRRSGPVKHILE